MQAHCPCCMLVLGYTKLLSSISARLIVVIKVTNRTRHSCQQEQSETKVKKKKRGGDISRCRSISASHDIGQHPNAFLLTRRPRTCRKTQSGRGRGSARIERVSARYIGHLPHRRRYDYAALGVCGSGRQDADKVR
ncbi:uncharacterized protein LOC119585852 [Penaeus monodon]|uniref:uncharacterized protein LOC119585852 n=1 Tax=Penaeus monodon TaxID=6687 RepID=UPI0018A7BBB6|nr:uncharacterized protein LOC119585852 [Penaeus monodon]